MCNISKGRRDAPRRPRPPDPNRVSIIITIGDAALLSAAPEA